MIIMVFIQLSHTLLVRAPRQARSRESYRRMLDAAEAVMEEKSFDEATVGEIVERAGLTVGAFYARFEDKNALLACLEDRLREEMNAHADAVDDTEWAREPIGRTLRPFVRRLVRVYQRRRAVARALVLRSRSDPALRARLEKLNRRNLSKVSRFLEARVPRRSREQAANVEFALLAMRCVLRETVLFREAYPGRRPPTEDELTDQLTRLLLRHAGLDATAGAAHAPRGKRGRSS
jgi:AcrR family transcriptional regulator